MFFTGCKNTNYTISIFFRTHTNLSRNEKSCVFITFTVFGKKQASFETKNNHRKLGTSHQLTYICIDF